MGLHILIFVSDFIRMLSVSDFISMVRFYEDGKENIKSFCFFSIRNLSFLIIKSLVNKIY